MASTIKNVISDLRGLIKQVQDDSVYTDKFLFSLLSKAKAKILVQRLRRNRLSDYNWETFCIRLESAKSHDCDCVAVGCEVRKSTFQLPRTISSRNMDLLKVETLSGKLVRHVTEEQLRNETEDEIKSGAIAWSLRSRYLIIWNSPKLEYIQVTGVWEDVSEWDGIQACVDVEGENTPCVDAKSADFGMEAGYIDDVYNIVLNKLGITLRLKEDTNANQNPEI